MLFSNFFTNLLPLKDFEADLDVLDIATNYMKGIDEKHNSIFTYSDVKLNGEKKFNRSEETNLGDLVTDAMLWEISKK